MHAAQLRVIKPEGNSSTAVAWPKPASFTMPRRSARLTTPPKSTNPSNGKAKPKNEKGVKRKIELNEVAKAKVQKVDLDRMMNECEAKPTEPENNENDNATTEAATDGITDAIMTAMLDDPCLKGVKRGKHMRHRGRFPGMSVNFYMKESGCGTFAYLTANAIRNNAVLVARYSGTRTLRDFICVDMSNVTHPLFDMFGFVDKPSRNQLEEKFKTIKCMEMSVFLKRNKKDFSATEIHSISYKTVDTK